METTISALFRNNTLETPTEKFPSVHIRDTHPDLYHIAFLALGAVKNYGYEGRRGYTFYFYGKYKASVSVRDTGYTIRVYEIGWNSTINTGVGSDTNGLVDYYKDEQ